MRVEAVLASNGRVRLRFTAVAGRTYAIQFRDQLDQGPWTTRHRISGVAAAGVREWEDDIGATPGQRFYRVITPAD